MSSSSRVHGRRRFPWKAITLLVLLGAGAFGLWQMFRGNENLSYRLQSVPVEEGPVVQRVIASGQLNPLRTVQVGSQVSGIINELMVDFNSEVKAGQVIARLDPLVFEANLRLAEAELERAQVRADFAKRNFERLSSLRESEMVPPAEVESAQIDFAQAAADVRIRAEHVQRARIELERCTILAPTDGVVISRNVDVGQTVAASLSAPVLFQIAENLDRLQINTLVPEADIGTIREGQRVEFRVDAYRELTLHGEVVQIRRAPIMRDNVVTYDTIVFVDNSDGLLLPGMTAEVFIITQEKPSAIRARNTALRARLPEWLTPASPPAPAEEGNWRIVYLVDSESPLTPRARWVEIGISDGVHTEIIQGLEPGDRLATHLVTTEVDASSQSPRASLLTGRQATF